MTNIPTPYEPKATDDGFHGSPNSGQLLKGTYLKWSDAAHWVDRDGLAPPSPLLVIAVDEALQKWKAGKAEIIRDKPLPSAEQLNSTIPQSAWEPGIDGQPRKPWAHIIVVYLVDITSGGCFTYTSATIGSHIAYDALREAVVTVRTLRGARVMPVVNLSERPMKTAFGMRRRPHFEIIGWKTPGEEARAIPPRPVPPQQPQLAAPAAAVASPVTPSPVTPNPAPNGPAEPYQPKPKAPVNLTNETLAAMGEVKPVTVGEILNDELPW